MAAKKPARKSTPASDPDAPKVALTGGQLIKQRAAEAAGGPLSEADRVIRSKGATAAAPADDE